MLTSEHAARFADIALGHVSREYPHKLDQVLTGSHDLQPPSTLHPIFYGSFDWHSCVHAYWLFVRLLRRCPSIPQSERIRALLSTTFTPAHVSAEIDYLASPYAGTFERPYGWAWLLMLSAELTRHEGDEARRWSASLAPLAEELRSAFWSICQRHSIRSAPASTRIPPSRWPLRWNLPMFVTTGNWRKSSRRLPGGGTWTMRSARHGSRAVRTFCRPV